MSAMTRFGCSFPYTLAAEATAKPILMEGMAGGSVQCGAAKTILVYGCNKDNPYGETFVRAYDEDGVAVTCTVADAYIQALPAACYGYRYIKLVVEAGGTVYVHLKS
jgi:hypothetical protein